MPEVLKNAVQNSLPPRPAAATPTFVAGGSSTALSYGQPKERDSYGYQDRERGSYDRQGGYGGNDSIRSAIQFASQSEPEFSSQEEAEAAFMKLLKRSGVQVDWSWEQAMRATIKDPQYRAIKDPKDRKAAFEKYVIELRSQEKEKEKDRVEKLRSDFRSMLRSHPEIKHYSRWKSVREIIKDETIFRSAKSEEERRQLFEEYIVELRKAYTDDQAAHRSSAMNELKSILGALDLAPYTTWSEAESILQSNETIKSNNKFDSLSKLDFLVAFENHIRALEQELNAARQKERRNKARTERQNRDAFIDLLSSLRRDGHIKAGTKWTDVHFMVKEHPAYLAMLGQTGSTPLDLFWDIVEEEESILRGKRNQAYDVLEDRRYEVTPKTTLEQFSEIMHSDRRTSNFDPDTITLIHERILDKVKKRSEEDRHQADRQQRHAVEDLRSRIKHLEPPIKVGETWEQVRPRIEKTEEFRAVATDDLRRSAFDKVMRRLVDKEEDRERERNRRDRGHRERDRDRDRRDRDDREYRDHRRHRTMTPAEPDAYEAERKKAQADRERHNRDRTGLTPPLRRERDDRDRYERGSVSRQVSSSHYDRERREREAERERSYISRADPRDRTDELDYGDSRPSSVRRRRESDGASIEGMRDSKVRYNPFPLSFRL